MSPRQSHSTDRPWEVACGYSRAVRVGPYAETALCSPCAPDGTVLQPGDVYQQTLACLDIVRESLEAVGMTMADVVKTRIYVVDPQHWKDSGRAHGEVFAGIRPALGWVYMSSFFAPASRWRWRRRPTARGDRADRVRADQAGRAMLFQAAHRQDDAAPALRESRFEDRQAHFGEAHR